MNYWLFLADPKAYSFDDLEKDTKARWDGIAGSLAQKHLRNIRKDDVALIYHTAPDKAVIGTAKIVSDPYPDPKDKEKKLVVVDIEASARMKKPVALSALKQNKKLAGMTFMKIQRIAVSPVSKTEFDEIVKMGR